MLRAPIARVNNTHQSCRVLLGAPSKIVGAPSNSMKYQYYPLFKKQKIIYFLKKVFLFLPCQLSSSSVFLRCPCTQQSSISNLLLVWLLLPLRHSFLLIWLLLLRVGFRSPRLPLHWVFPPLAFFVRFLPPSRIVF